MRETHLVLISGLVGAVAASAVWLALADGREGGPDPAASVDLGEERSTMAPAMPEDDPAVAVQLALIQNQLAQLTDEVAKLREARAAPLRVPVSEAGDLPLDEAALTAALERVEATRAAKRLAGLTDQQLLDEARRLRQKDPISTQTILGTLLERQLEPSMRSKALAQLGVAHRRGGDLAKSEQLLFEASQLGGVTDEGAYASYQLALTVSARGDPVRALAIADTVAQNREIDTWVRMHGEWAKATLTEETGDVVSARAQYERLLAEYGGDKQHQWLVNDLTKRLDTLR